LTDRTRITLSAGLAVLIAGVALVGGAGIAGAPCVPLAIGSALTLTLSVQAMIAAHAIHA